MESNKLNKQRRRESTEYAESQRLQVAYSLPKSNDKACGKNYKNRVRHWVCHTDPRPGSNTGCCWTVFSCMVCQRAPLSYCAGRRLQIDGYLRRQRLSRGPAADDCCWRAKNTLATNCCLFWARFYGNHLLCIYVGIKILYLASAILQVSGFNTHRKSTDFAHPPLLWFPPWLLADCAVRFYRHN